MFNEIPEYPRQLRSFSFGKSVTRPANYEVTNPLYGAPYVRMTTTDTPDIITGQIIIERHQMPIFHDFLRKIRHGVDVFSMQFQNEFGLVSKVVQALPDSFRSYRQISSTAFVYDVSIVIANNEQNAYVDDFKNTLDWNDGDVLLFDEIVNTLL